MSFDDVALADFDGDGDLDVFAWGVVAQFLLLNDGLGKFKDVSATQLPKPGAGGRNIAVLDFDNDGDADVVQPGASAGAATLWTNDGKARFTSSALPALFTLGLFGRFVVTDVDGDGDADLFELGFTPRLLINAGQGRWSEARTSQWPKAIYPYPVIGDFDNDGDDDILALGGTLGSTTYVPRFFRNNKGIYSIDASVVIPARSRTQATTAMALDIDGDSRLDVLAHDSGQQLFTVLRSTQAGGFVEEILLPQLSIDLLDARIADIDLDGDPDIIGGRQLASTGIVTNLHRQLVVPRVVRLGVPLDYRIHAASSQQAVAYQPWLAASRLPNAIRLPSFGYLGVSPTAAWLLPPLTIGSGKQSAIVRPRFPNDPALRGLKLWFQAFIAPEARLSNIDFIEIR